MMSRIREDGGAVAVLTAVMAVMLFGIAALVVDLGIARDNRRQAQNTADSAALAAANALYATTSPNLNKPGDFRAAVDAAKSYAATNYGTTQAEWARCVNPEPLAFQFPGTATSCISFDSFLYPKQVLVVVPLRKQPSIFGGVFGYTGVSIGALAQARLDPGGKNVCTFCVLGEGTQSIQNGNLTVSNGDMYFNGSVDIKNNGYAGSLAGYITGEDGTQVLDGGNAYVSGSVAGDTSSFQGGKGQIGQPKIVDPLAAYQLPFVEQSRLSAKPNGNPCLDGPGIYAGYKSASGAPCVMQPGLYVFTGDFELAGTGELQANGVTFYFTCGTGTTPAACRPGSVANPGEMGGGMKISGRGGYQITAPLAATNPTLPAELYGWALVYDRYNNASMTLVGNGTSSITGTIYGVNATLDLRGNGGTDSLASMVVVGGLNFDGNNATMNVAFDSSKNVKPSEGARGLVR